MVAVRQVTISNLSLCHHPPLLIPLFPSLYPSFFFLPFSPHNPFPYFYYALPFSVPLIPSFPLALPLIPRPLSSNALESFCIFPGPRELWLDLPLGENKGTLFALFVVLSFSRQINTPATICLSPLLSLALVSIFFSPASMVRLVSHVREGREWMVMNGKAQWATIWYCFHHWLSLSLQDQGEAIAHTMTAQRSNARIEGLKAGTPYVVQVRARTVAGYGRYSSPADFSTNLQSMLLPYLLHYPGICWYICGLGAIPLW